MTLARSPMKKATTRQCGCPSNLGVGRHRRACAKWKPAPKPKARKPIPHRNAKRRPADLASAQRRIVMERAKGLCEFEIICECDDHPRGFHPCRNRHDLQACHLIRRHQCGDAIYDPDVAIAGCDWCHARFDHRAPRMTWDHVRAPESAVARAIACVKRYETERAARGKAVVRLKGTK